MYSVCLYICACIHIYTDSEYMLIYIDRYVYIDSEYILIVLALQQASPPPSLRATTRAAGGAPTAPRRLDPAPCTLHPAPCTLNPKPSTLNP